MCLPLSAFGHGTVSSPKSRVLRVYEDLVGGGSNHPATDAAINHAGSGAYFTWNQVAKNIVPYSGVGEAPYLNGNKIPDGQLASGASGTGLNFSGLDLVSNSWDWPAQEVAPGSLDLTWYATATHDPSYFKAWITKADYNHKTPLAWGKMEFLGDLTHSKVGQNYFMNVILPERTGRHVLYVVWQRIDPAGEAFFSAVDLNFSGGGGGPVHPPAVSIEDRNVPENGGTVSVPVILSRSVSAGSTGSVDYETISISATPGSDYITQSGTLTFSPNQLVENILIPILNDSDEEVSEIFRVTLSNPQGMDLGVAVSTVTITDDDSANPGGYSFEKTSDWGSGYQGWFHLSNPGPDSWLNPTLTFDLPAGAGFSYFDSRFSHSIDANGRVTVTGLGSIPSGADLSIDMVISPAPGSNDGPANVQINGIDLGALAPEVSIADVEQNEGDGAGESVSLTVSLASAYSESIHVSYTTVDGTAEAGSDFVAKSGTLEFAPGQTQKTITINYDGDVISEGDKDFLVVLGSVPGQALPNFVTGGSQARVTLLDDDRAIRLTATGSTVVEGDSGTKNMTFRLFLDREVKQGETASVGFYTHGHGAGMNVDFTHTTGQLTFAPGASSGTINVPIIGDTEDEVLERVMVHFENPTGIQFDSYHAMGMIVDNEFDSSGFGGQRVVAYVDGTGGASSMPPADRVTHICLAFANLDVDGNLIGGGSGSSSMRAQNPNLRFLLSVGGWTWSANFSGVAADPVKRRNFAVSCRSKIVNNDLDGIDLDWEWPGVPGGPGTVPDPNDGHNYTLLVQALREELDGLEAQTGKKYEITAYAPAGAGIGELELPQLAQLFDFVNVQGYDLHGSWDSRTGHQAGLFHNPADPQSDQLNIDAILKKYLAGGFTKDQLLVGAPFYGQQWHGVENIDNGLFQSGSGSGQVTYRELQSKIETIPRFWDDEAKTAYLYDRGTGNWLSLDDAQSMFEKASYSLHEGFGGVFYWQHGGDTDDLHLLGTISDTLAFGIQRDRDGDGVDDAWELANFGNLDSANGTTNADGDSMSDLEESKAGTDPVDPASFLGIINLSLQTGSPTFEIRAGTIPCDLQYSPSLLPGSWVTISSGHSSGSYTETEPVRLASPGGFYRLTIAGTGE